MSSSSPPPQADVSTEQQNGVTRLHFTGALIVHTLPALEKKLRKKDSGASGTLLLDIHEVEKLDTAGALFLNTLSGSLQKNGNAARIEGADELQEQLLEKSRLPREKKQREQSRPPLWLRWTAGTGKAVLEGLCLVGQLVGFLGKFLVTLGQLILHPQNMRWTSLVFHMEQVGLRAVPIVALLTFLIGMVVAYMGAEQLARFGAQIFAVNLLEVTVMREMAVLITSIVVAGRSSSSFTAQIGAMIANEEIAALQSMGLDPNVLLVVPRVLALLLCLPMLVFIADIMSLLGGAVAIWYTMGMSFSAFVSQFHDVASYDNFIVGMIKTPFFALTIGLVGCFQGFRATSSAESVGMLTTVSVVQSIFIVILLDALFAIFFTTIGF